MKKIFFFILLATLLKTVIAQQPRWYCSLPYKSDSLKVDNLPNFKLFNYEEIKIHRDPDCGDSQAV